MNEVQTKNTGLSTLEHIIREQLGLPVSHLVLAEIVEISREIPENTNTLTPSHAQYLAGKFLKGMDLCGELYAISVGYELKMEVLKKKEHGLAFIVRSKNLGLKTAKEKEAYANTDDLYVEISDKYAESKMFRIRVESMRKDFEKAHYLMRKIAEGDSDLEATFSSDPGQSSPGDKKWQDWTDTNTNENSNKRKSW